MPSTTIAPLRTRATVRPFRPEDIWQIEPQLAQATEYAEYFHDSRTQALMEAGEGWTAVRADNSLMGCAGLLPDTPGCAQVWSIVDVSVTGMEFMRAHCMIRKVLNEAMTRYDYIKFYADADFPQAIRWAQLLGFDLIGIYMRLVPTKRKFMVFSRKGIV